jgi:predicted nucleic acid-binding protein
VDDVWVVNASPIIALAKVGHLHLLKDLCKELLVPDVVASEVLAGPPSDPARLAFERGWGSAVVPCPIVPELLEWGLGPGETAVLAVARERKSATAVLDDSAARTCAKALGVQVIGTVGVVLRARKEAIIPSAANVLESLRAQGLWLDNNTIRAAVEGVGEIWREDA